MCHQWVAPPHIQQKLANPCGRDPGTIEIHFNIHYIHLEPIALFSFKLFTHSPCKMIMSMLHACVCFWLIIFCSHLYLVFSLISLVSNAISLLHDFIRFLSMVSLLLRRNQSQLTLWKGLVTIFERDGNNAHLMTF